MRALVLLAVFLRAVPYLANRSFWGDEVMIALSLRARELAGLLAPLEYDQTMPIPILLLVKLTVMVLGNHELVYRLPIFVAGCALPFIVLVWFPRLIGQAESLIVLAFVAVWQPLLYYSSELKQYGVDATMTAVLIVVTLRLLQPSAGAREWRHLIGWGAAAILVSQPAVLVLTGTAAAILVDPRTRSDRSWQRRGGVAIAVWGVALLAVYLVSYRHVLGSAYMREYWENAFLTPGPGWTARARGAAWTLAGASDLPGLRTLIILPLVAAGGLHLWRTRGPGAGLLLGIPFAALAGVATLGLYPIAARLVLFTAPLLFWGIASAIAGIGRLLRPRPGAALAAALFALAWIPVAVRAFRYVANPPLRETTRDLVRHVERVDPGAPVVVLFRGYPGWVYYAGDWSDPRARIEGARREFHCLVDSPRPPECDTLQFRDRPNGAITLVSTPPRGAPAEAVDRRWSERLADRVLALRDPRVWLFYAVYAEDLAPHRLIERLRDRLSAGGARVDPPILEGESALYRVTLP